MEIRWVTAPLAEVPRHGPVWERVRSLQAQEGMVGILRGVARRLVSFVWEARRATVFVRSLEAVPAPSPRIPVVMRDMTVEDLNRFFEGPSRLSERQIREFEDRLRTGRIGVIVFAGEEVAGYGWLTMRDEVEQWSGAEIVLEEGEGYFFDAFTFPRFRARGIHTSVHLWRLNRLKELGCTVAYSIAASRDPGAQKAHRNVGFVDFREIASMRLAGMRWHTTRAPRAG